MNIGLYVQIPKKKKRPKRPLQLQPTILILIILHHQNYTHKHFYFYFYFLTICLWKFFPRSSWTRNSLRFLKVAVTFNKHFQSLVAGEPVTNFNILPFKIAKNSVIFAFFTCKSDIDRKWQQVRTPPIYTKHKLQVTKKNSIRLLNCSCS